MQVRIQKLKERLEKPDHITMLALALLFGIIAGVVAFVYNSYFEGLLTLTWELVPEKLVEPFLRDAHERLGFPSPDRLGWIYTITVSTFMGTMAGLTQRLLGSPGDLPDTVRCIHQKGSIPIRQAPSMFICSAFSIAAGENCTIAPVPGVKSLQMPLGLCMARLANHSDIAIHCNALIKVHAVEVSRTVREATRGPRCFHRVQLE